MAPAVPEGESRLEHSYSFWFTQRNRGSVSSSPTEYEDQIKHVGSFSTVSERERIPPFNTVRRSSVARSSSLLASRFVGRAVLVVLLPHGPAFRSPSSLRRAPFQARNQTNVGGKKPLLDSFFFQLFRARQSQFVPALYYVRVLLRLIHVFKEYNTVSNIWG